MWSDSLDTLEAHAATCAAAGVPVTIAADRPFHIGEQLMMDGIVVKITRVSSLDEHARLVGRASPDSTYEYIPGYDFFYEIEAMD